MIPPDPKAMTDIDFSLPVFLTKNGENVVKGEQVLSDGRRVILFTTNEHLKILARAHQILGDGTFRITPGLWCQTFIISAEVSSGVFVPVCFCLLPDKKKESYEVMFKGDWGQDDQDGGKCHRGHPGHEGQYFQTYWRVRDRHQGDWQIIFRLKSHLYHSNHYIT